MMKLKREKVQPNFLKDWKPVKDGSQATGMLRLRSRQWNR